MNIQWCYIQLYLIIYFLLNFHEPIRVYISNDYA